MYTTVEIMDKTRHMYSYMYSHYNDQGLDHIDLAIHTCINTN